MSKTRQDLEHALEDVVGFNFRSLRTVRDLVLRRQRIFEAYRDGERGAYTPAIRIWLALLSVSFLLILLLSEKSALLEQVVESDPAVRQALMDITGDKYQSAIDLIGETSLTLQAPVLGVITALSVFLLKPLLKGLTFSARFNIVFATLSTGTLTSIAASLPVLLGLVPITALASVAVWLAYFLTFWRGSKGPLAETHRSAGLRALGVSTIMIVLVVAANTLNIMISTVYAFHLLDI